MKKDSLMKKSFVLLLLVSLVAALVLAGLISSKKQQQGNEGNVTLIVASLGKTTAEKCRKTYIFRYSFSRDLGSGNKFLY